MKSKPPIHKNLVLVGGGHSHSIVLKMFGQRPLEGLSLTLISDVSQTPYSGMLPGLIAGNYTFNEAHIDLQKLCKFAGAKFIQSGVKGVDLENKSIILEGLPKLNYDLLSINTGITPDISGIPGANRYAIKIKPVQTFLKHWQNILKDFEKRLNLKIAVVGAGAGGVELALSICTRFESLSTNRDFEIHLFHNKPEILETHSKRVRKTITKILRKRGIILHLKQPIIEVNENQVLSESGHSTEVDYVIWTTSASAPEWPRASGFDVDQHGFIKVEKTLQTSSDQSVFAAGDIASMYRNPRPKSGVFAVRQGGPLFENLRAAALGENLQEYNPQKLFLSLIGTGMNSAVASRGAFVLNSALMWKWKEYIDRKFMARFEV